MSRKVGFQSKDDPQASYEINQDDFLIGRGKECAVVLPDESVSRLQARVHFENGTYFIDNLGRNPTYVNGQTIETSHVLQDGDEITMGRTSLIFQPGGKAPNGVIKPRDMSKTFLVKPPPVHLPSPRMIVTYPSGEKRSFPLDKTRYLLGRDSDCDICFSDNVVSKHHAEICFDGKTGRLRDLNSSNGTYLNGKPIKESVLPREATILLGSGGPGVRVIFEGVPEPAPEHPVTREDIERQFLGNLKPEGVGTRTQMLLQTFHHLKKKHTRRYRLILGVLSFLLVASVGTGIYQYMKLRAVREMAVQIFYTMKTMSLQIANIEDEMAAVKESKRLEEIASKKQALLDMEKQYEKLVGEIGIVRKIRDEKDRTILRVARILGECEVEMPDGFVKEVKKYIAKWRTTPRLEQAMRRIRAKKYAPVVIQVMKSNGLPPQFLYLAIQESSFDERAVGPRTTYGYAKGIWQFIPETAQEYGLSVGPLVNEPTYDPLDKRFDFVAATKAAGRFLRDIYKTDAQASGLLVMASYNWGPTPIKERIRQLPENPADRNFWKLLKYHKIPQETYDYVFYIFSAIVIGENPRLFGFDFDNPLAESTA